jgi:hypothetical protein
MEKITLKLHEVYELNLELKGSTNQQTGETIRKGILDEKISISVKYWLDKLSLKLKTEIDLVEKLKEEIIKKLGVVDEQGNYSIPLRINEKFDDKEELLLSYDVNPTFLEYQAEFEQLINQEVEIEYNSINLEDINIQSEVYPRILFKLTKQS